MRSFVLATILPTWSHAWSMMTTAQPVTTLAGIRRAEDTIKKSRFIAHAEPAATAERAKEVLAAIQTEHAKARHWCWAWRGVGDETRYSDNGEPGGTAGQPILGAILAEGLSETVVVVTRYFGGIKLGTGGLVRAYGGTARLCLRGAERVVQALVSTIVITAPLDAVGPLYHAVHGCERLKEAYLASGEVELTVAVSADRVADVRRRLANATSGRACVAVRGTAAAAATAAVPG